ncbi:MAG: hypothetical protein AUJ51_04770 [Elusimicrobia bacterium CG1_02_56_21]|nr:MAG: hypothetical protein AUJ51_04770 [Elusimicrobia bacterium CG1_02_56_21]
MIYRGYSCGRQKKAGGPGDNRLYAYYRAGRSRLVKIPKDPPPRGHKNISFVGLLPLFRIRDISENVYMKTCKGYH